MSCRAAQALSPGICVTSRGELQASEAQGEKSHNVTSPAFCWLKQVTKQLIFKGGMYGICVLLRVTAKKFGHF